MIQSYSLSDSMPTIPTPHDCVVKRIYQAGEDIIFAFENNITMHDSAKYFCPTAKSLTMRFHLIDMEFDIYRKNIKRELNGFISEFTSVDANELFKIADGKRELEYLCHYVSFNSIILILWSDCEIRLEFPSVDYVELNWIE